MNITTITYDLTTDTVVMVSALQVSDKAWDSMQQLGKESPYRAFRLKEGRWLMLCPHLGYSWGTPDIEIPPQVLLAHALLSP